MLCVHLRNDLSDDLRYLAKLQFPDMGESFSDEIYKRAFIDIENGLVHMALSKLSLYGLPEIDQSGFNAPSTNIIRDK